MVESLKEYALCLLDTQGIIRTWNAGAQRITGYSAPEIIGQSFDIFYLPQERNAGKPRQEIAQATAGGRFETEGWRLRRDGSQFWANVITTAVRDTDGTLRGFTKVTRDLTAQRQAQQATADAYAQIQGVINTAVDGILAIDERGTIEWLNPAALRIFGYSQQELLGQNIKILMPEPYHSQHDQYLSNYRATSQAKIIGIGREVQGRRKDGTHFPLDLAVSEVHLGDRRIFTGIVRDITQRKEAERLLVEAKEAAEAANRAKDQFLAIVSHELRTPLTPIIGAVSFLEHKPDLDPDVREEVRMIRRNVEHEAQLVDDLLNLTRLARGKIELHYEVLDVHALLRQVLGHFAAEFVERRITLTTTLRAAANFSWADPLRIGQVLNNLLQNALKFTPEGGAVTVRSTNPEKGKLRLEISDTGIGIAPDVLPRLFRPFEQGERTITRTYGGLGLGLAISKGIVDLHGGKLTACSEGLNQGATFTVELATAVVAPDKAAATNGRGTGCAAFRILLVEDHKDTLRILGKMLKMLGYQLLTAGSVQEALQLAACEPFDVLVSDIGLPDGSGLDIIRRIRKGAAAPIKAIAISGFGEPEDIVRSRDAGFVDHLIKPLDFQRLETVLRELTHGVHE